MPAAAGIKVEETTLEKTKLKEVVATVVAGEEVEATKMATMEVAAKFPKKPPRSSPQSSLKVLNFFNSLSSQVLKSSSFQALKFSSFQIIKVTPMFFPY